MKPSSRFLVLIFSAGILGGLTFGLYHETLSRHFLEYLFNREGEKLYLGSIRVGRVQWDRDLKIHFGLVQGELKRREGPIPFRIHSAKSLGSPLNFFSREGLTLRFEGARLLDSRREGIGGTLRLRGGGEGFFELKAQIRAVGLDELKRLTPAELAGSSGEIKGDLTVRREAKGEVFFATELKVEEPGGRLPARFFGLLTPYLPQASLREEVQKLQEVGGLIGFRDASLKIDLVEQNQMKVFLHLAIPDYNLDLNVQIQIRLEEKEALRQLAELVTGGTDLAEVKDV